MTRIFLDHAATTPLLPEARAALLQGLDLWANPSSPHGEGRGARRALEDARARIKETLHWTGEVIFTSGASEAIALAVKASKKPLSAVSAVEHEAVLRHAGANVAVLAVDAAGIIVPDAAVMGGLVAVQQVNNETGVIQPLGALAAQVRENGGWLLADCAQSAGKLALPDCDMAAISAHKFGGPVGVGALLVKGYGMLNPTGGQERGYRAGTENLPGVLAMAAALAAGDGWLADAAILRKELDAIVVESGGEIVGSSSPRLAAIASYRLPGMSSAAQLIRFDASGIALSAGSACSSGSLKASHVLTAMGFGGHSEVVRVSIGRETTRADIERFAEVWRAMAVTAARKAGTTTVTGV